MADIFEPESHILLQLDEIFIMSEEDGGIHRLLFCVMFWVQTRIICLQLLKIIGDVDGILNGFCGKVVV